jgi:hypothetical protein
MEVWRVIAEERLTDSALKQVERESYAFFAKLYPRRFCEKTQSKETEYIRWLLATNPNTPAPILDCLASEDIVSLLERIAEHPRTRQTTLARLATHENPRVRAAIAENPNIDKKTMWRLAGDIHPDVRLRLAESYSIPAPILQALAQDDNPYVQSRARKTLNRLDQPMVVTLSVGCC